MSQLVTLSLIVSVVCSAMAIIPALMMAREERRKRAEPHVTITIEDKQGVRSCTIPGEKPSEGELRREFQRLIDQAA